MVVKGVCLPNLERLKIKLGPKDIRISVVFFSIQNNYIGVSVYTI